MWSVKQQLVMVIDTGIFCVKMTVQPDSHNLGTDSKGYLFIWGNRWADIVLDGNVDMCNSAVCVDCNV